MDRRNYLIKVLLVDNDEGFLNYERQIIGDQVPGEIYTALDGETAFNIYQKYFPDIILTNLDLPLLNGYELIRRIRDLNSEIDSFIIVITESSDITDEVFALKLGANNYLCKPLRPIKLINYFNTAINAISSVLELKFEKYLLEQRSSEDTLTGLINRDYLFKRYREEASKAYRYKRNLSCIRLDFDEYENILSMLGRKKADEILKEGSNLLKKSLRKSDIIGRVEKSEIGILLPETNIYQAKTTGRKLQDVVAKNQFIAENKFINTTVSAGISSNAYQKSELDSIFEKAKEALQQAKQTGPNSIILCSST